MATISDALAAAWQHHRQGDLSLAEQGYRQVLQIAPDHAGAWFLLGAVCQTLGQSAEAVTCYREALRTQPWLSEAQNNLGVALEEGGHSQDALACYREAVRLKPDYAEALSNLGALLTSLGQSDEGLACCLRAVKLRPDFAQAHNNLGLALASQGKLDEALSQYEEALRLQPDYADTHNNRGVALTGQRRFADAVASHREALRLRPDYPEALNNLGVALRFLGRLEEALRHYGEALRLRPAYAEALSNYGDVLLEQGKVAEAMGHFRKALRLRPDHPEAHHSLGLAQAAQGRVDEAVASYKEAVRLRPGYADALTNLGNAYKVQGQLDEAIACYRQALVAEPATVATYSNLLLALHYQPGYEPEAVFAEHRRWAQLHAAPLAPVIPPAGARPDPGRRLRIGYFSPDFREHVQGYFSAPILAAHDREHFEVIGYADMVRPDAVTERCQRAVDHWRSLVGLSDAEAAELIREDGVDILVDLAGHTGGNRLLVFARKPAPVQVTLYGYAASTGLPAMDYRITDAQADPPGWTEALHTEELVRLPEVWCYYQPPPSPAPAPPPSLRSGHVTFGSFNALFKVTPEVIALWARLLAAVSSSRLNLLGNTGAQGQQRLAAAFARNGIDPCRLSFLGRRPREEYFQLFAGVDVCLDPFPFAGSNTTCDALWMGVPVVTLAGRTCASRQGVALLAHLGLRDLIADTPEAYVAIASGLAGDPNRLRELRAGLRDRMRRATLTDATRYCRQLEEAFRWMWQRWCVRNSHAHCCG